MKKFVLSLMIGMVLSASADTFAGQMAKEKALHPRIAKAIDALKNAEAYMKTAPHDFGGHRAEAMKADEAIKHRNLALQYRARATR